MEELKYSKSANRVATVELPTGELLGSGYSGLMYPTSCISFSLS